MIQDNLPNNLRAALYARVSTEEQREGQTIDSQVAELTRFAEDKGWAIASVYKDEGWSGSLLGRPELDRLRDDASKDKFTIAVINDVDRLARDVTHLGVIKRDLERHGVQVVFRKLPAEKSPTQNLMVNILGSFAEFERELIADRTRRGKRHKVEVRKQYLGSIAPYGFRYKRKDQTGGKEGVLTINAEEAAVVRQMYSWVDVEGLSARKVLERLNRLSLVPRKANKTWAKSSVLRILRSEVYAGTWHYNKHESCVPNNSIKLVKYRKSSKSSRRLRAREEWLPVSLPESLHIVSRAQWQRVQTQLNRNKVFSPRNEKHTYFLKGLVRCAGCGARYVGQPCHGKFYYRCIARCKKNPSIKEGQLDTSVWNAVKEAVLNPNIIAKQVSKLKQQKVQDTRSKEQVAAGVEQALLQIQDEEARLIEAYKLRILSAEQLAQQLGPLNRRRLLANAARASLSEQKRLRSSPTIKKSIVDYCRLAAQRLQTFKPEERIRFLRYLVREVVFDGSTARIRGVIPVPTDHHGTGTERGVNTDSNESSCDIATTTILEHGRNATSIFPEEDANHYFAFELVQAIPRTMRARRPKDGRNELGHSKSGQLAA